MQEAGKDITEACMTTQQTSAPSVLLDIMFSTSSTASAIGTSREEMAMRRLDNCSGSADSGK
jgi:hypothetical protein